MALLNIGEDPWVLELESCEKLHRDIMEHLSLRKREPRSNQKYAQISAVIRMRLKQYNNEVDQLKQKISQASNTHMITSDETERRTRQIEILQSKELQMQKMFAEHKVDLNVGRSQLLNSPGASGWSSDDDKIVDTSEYSVDQLRSQQNEMLKDQDQGLDNLAKIIARQKTIARTIGDEVDLHNEIIDDLGENIDRTDTRVIGETRTISTIDRKDKTCIYWVVIILLFISIITILLV